MIETEIIYASIFTELLSQIDTSKSTYPLANDNTFLFF